jgi:ketosteroid isomerase-like protein
VVQDFYAAYNAGDLEAIAELMDENVEYHVSDAK